MKEKSSVFMTLGTAVGLTIAVIIFVIWLLLIKKQVHGAHSGLSYLHLLDV